MKPFPLVIGVCGLLALVAGPTQAQQVLPKPPPPLPSVLGKSVVPVVRPPATPHRRRPRHAAPVVQPAVTAVAKPPAAAKPATKGAPAAAALATPTVPVPPPATPVAARPPPPKADPTKGTVTGLPLPRWVAFRSDEVNLRSGPGIQYPIDWQYHRRNLPVRITREFEAWRLVTDPDGGKGWVHQATLTGRRGFMVKEAERTLRQSASDEAKPVALLKPGVVGYVRSCATQSDWCELQAGGYRGWLKRPDFYGVGPDEAVN